MKRFGLLLNDNDYYAFMRFFPGYGERTTLLRKTVHRLIERAKVVGKAWDSDTENIADDLFKESKGE